MRNGKKPRSAYSLYASATATPCEYLTTIYLPQLFIYSQHQSPNVNGIAPIISNQSRKSHYRVATSQFSFTIRPKPPSLDSHIVSNPQCVPILRLPDPKCSYPGRCSILCLYALNVPPADIVTMMETLQVEREAAVNANRIWQ